MDSTIVRTSPLGKTAAQQQAIERINALDLEPIAYKLTYAEHDGDLPKMTLEQADADIALYRQFLILNILYPGQSFAPTRVIDEVWHTHILDTMKYARDCELIFGGFLHHFPYVGMRGPEDAAHLQETFATTRRLFQETFGVNLVADVADCEPNPNCEPTTCAICNSQVRPRPVRETVTA